MTRYRPKSLAAALTAVVALTTVPLWAAPYGMDPVPEAVFSDRPWDRYGLDPVPGGATSDGPARVDYGEDAIPSGHVPTILDLVHVLPHEALEVVTEAVEGEMPVGVGPLPRGVPCQR